MFQFYSQKDLRWSENHLGETPYTIRKFGCLVCSLSMVLGVEPLKIACKAELFASDGRIKSYSQVAAMFGASIVDNIPDPVIIRTSFDGLLHFVVRWQGRIYDPLSLSGNPLRDYRIISYIRLKPKESEEFMKLELFSDHRDIYVRLWGNFLVHIPSPEELTKYFGSNPQIQEVDDIHQAGIVASEIANRLGQLESDLARMTSQKDEQLAKNADLVSKITTCNHLFADESDKNSELQKEIDLQGKTIDKLKIQIKELQKNKPKIKHSWLWYSWLWLWRYIISLGKEKK